MTPNRTALKAGLVGAGTIAQFHIAALRRIPLEIAGIFDLNAAQAETIAAKYGVKAYPSMSALVEAGANVIHVLTPPATHTIVALEALNLGCHVLVEKPLAENVEDCERIGALAAERGLQVCVGHSFLFDPQIVRALQAVRSGRLGKVESVDVVRSSVYPPFEGGALPPQFRDAGYPFRDLGMHELYLLEAFLGPIERIDAEWQSLGREPNLAFDEWRAHVKCRNGTGRLQLSWNVKPIRHLLEIQGTKGVLRVELMPAFLGMRSALPLPGPIVLVVNAATDSIRALIEAPRDDAGFFLKQVPQSQGLQDLVRAFYRSLAAGTPVPVSAADATPLVGWVERVARRADAEGLARLARYPLAEQVPYLVTGASGAVGSAIVERLLAEGQRVRIFVRRPPERVPANVEVALGDLGDAAAVERAVKGAAIVIHAGAAMKGPWAAFQCATIVGTRNVLDASVKFGVKKLIHLSSISVVDWAGGDRDSAVTEATPYEPYAELRGSYARSKLEAERMVVEYTRRGLPTVILRPGQIFGGKIPLLNRAVARRVLGRYLVLGEGNVRLPLVHVDDVVDAVVSAASSDLHSGEIIQLVDTGVTQNDVLRELARGKPIVRIPSEVVFTLVGLSEIVLGAFKRKSPLSRHRVAAALAQRTFRSDGAKLIAWQPRTGVPEGIRREATRNGSVS